MHSGDTWQALGAHCHMLRSSAVRALVNIGLVVSTERALVVDTGAGVTDFWAHAGAARAMAATGESQRVEVAGPEPEPEPSAAREMDAVALDLGGVVVELFGLGPAHTCGDLMVGIPGGEGIRRTPGTPATYAIPATPGVLFAGDVLEEGEPASVEPESNVPGWIASLNQLATMGEKYAIMVPGHGSPVSADFAAAMAVRLEATQRT